MNSIHTQLGSCGIIPVVVIEDEKNAEPLAEALLQGGLTTMEITFRTAAAKNVLIRIAKFCPSMLLGAGTILTIDQLKAAVDAGAQYIVSPGLSRTVVEYCLKNGITVLPGAVTPTEIQAALELGVDVLKFFPAEAAGGPEYVKAVGAPFKNVKFIPTGGIDESNFLKYLSNPQVLACGGSWMVKPALISGKRFDEIRQLTSSAVEKLRNFRLTGVEKPLINDARST